MKQLPDWQIIQAALDAELCLPRCWDLVDPRDPSKPIIGEWGEVERERMRELRRFANRILELAEGPLLEPRMAELLKDTPSSTDCCDAWPTIRPQLTWFSFDEAPNLHAMPCVSGTMIRVNKCPSCGANRRAALWNVNDDRTD